MKTNLHLPGTSTNRQQGFTILELMIATAIFSIIILVAAAGILRFSADYYKGVNSANTQAVARAVLSDVVQSIQFSASDVKTLAGLQAKGYCIDDTEYDYVVGPQLSPSQHVLIKRVGNCSAATPTMNLNNPATQHELLSDKMRLSQFTINCGVPTQASCSVEVAVAFGEGDLLTDGTHDGNSPLINWSKASCSGRQGQQYCAVAHLQTTVQRRL